jgi:DNA-binding response OmpR family regulator
MGQSILVVEDEGDFAWGLQRLLEFEGYLVGIAPTGRAAWAEIHRATPDLMILDLRLPDCWGTDLIVDLRRQQFSFPIVVLTAHADAENRVAVMQAGADDIVQKPIDVLPFMARIAARLRSARVGPATAGGITVDPIRREVRVGARSVRLTEREWALLGAIMRGGAEGRTRRELMQEVWRLPADAQTNSLNVYLHRLRRKLAKVGAARALRTVRGKGVAWRPNLTA